MIMLFTTWCAATRRVSATAGVLVFILFCCARLYNGITIFRSPWRPSNVDLDTTRVSAASLVNCRLSLGEVWTWNEQHSVGLSPVNTACSSAPNFRTVGYWFDWRLEKRLYLHSKWNLLRNVCCYSWQALSFRRLPRQNWIPWTIRLQQKHWQTDR